MCLSLKLLMFREKSENQNNGNSSYEHSCSGDYRGWRLPLHKYTHKHKHNCTGVPCQSVPPLLSKEHTDIQWPHAFVTLYPPIRGITRISSSSLQHFSHFSNMKLMCPRTNPEWFLPELETILRQIQSNCQINDNTMTNVPNLKKFLLQCSWDREAC